MIVSRPNISNLHIPSAGVVKDELKSPQSERGGSGDKVLVDTSDDMQDKDDSYTTHHPRPAAVCTLTETHSHGLALDLQAFVNFIC